MKRTRTLFRIVFFLLTVSLLVYLNSKTDDDVVTVAEFKLKMIEKVQKDSLDNKHKLDMVIRDSTKFIDDSSHVREGIRYLMGVLGLFVTVELGFFILKRIRENN